MPAIHWIAPSAGTLIEINEAVSFQRRTTGLPVGGGIMAVAPGRLGIAAFAPPLDPYGNSVRAQVAIAHMEKRLRLNVYGD